MKEILFDSSLMSQSLFEFLRLFTNYLIFLLFPLQVTPSLYLLPLFFLCFSSLHLSIIFSFLFLSFSSHAFFVSFFFLSTFLLHVFAILSHSRSLPSLFFFYFACELPQISHHDFPGLFLFSSFTSLTLQLPRFHISGLPSLFRADVTGLENFAYGDEEKKTATQK